MRFIELFAGIGGFRLGLEKVEKDYQTQIRKTSTGIYLRSKRDSSNISTGSSRKRSSSFKNNVNSKQFSTQSGKTENKETSFKQCSSLVASESRTNTSKFCCVWANEWDKYACQIYRKNFGNKELIEKDITSITTKSIPDHDFLTAGFPCPSYSIAGKRQGFKDPRGIIFFEICRIAEFKQPRLLLLENVKGLLNHDGGNTFRIILDSLSELGYDCEWEVLNSKNFGVPQNRERVFIVGHLRGQGGQKIFPFGESNRNNNKSGEEREIGVRNAIGIDANYYKGADGKRTMINIIEDFYPDRIRTFKQSPTLRGGRQGLKVKKGISIRRLTPIEYERLQGFPDNWTEGISDTQRYKCLGNAVTVNVIEEIGRKLIND